MNEYISGTLLELTCDFTKVSDGSFADPTSVTCKVKGPAPGNVVTDLTSVVVKNDVGQYSAPFTPTVAGIYTQQWIGTGAVPVTVLAKFCCLDVTF